VYILIIEHYVCSIYLVEVWIPYTAYMSLVGVCWCMSKVGPMKLLVSIMCLLVCCHFVAFVIAFWFNYGWKNWLIVAWCGIVWVIVLCCFLYFIYIHNIYIYIYIIYIYGHRDLLLSLINFHSLPQKFVDCLTCYLAGGLVIS